MGYVFRLGRVVSTGVGVMGDGHPGHGQDRLFSVFRTRKDASHPLVDRRKRIALFAGIEWNLRCVMSVESRWSQERQYPDVKDEKRNTVD